ncbi:hypothetical protein [Mycobacterium tuberculosis]|uniref:hypothetical protein n=1 Tax=Mycobacterium tuberculosis TaxID=1773 RepID=UPI00272C1376|nr:hypothetical protein [Mycobacterium tuberculosis]
MPAIYVYGGTILPGHYKGQDLNIVSVFAGCGPERGRQAQRRGPQADRTARHPRHRIGIQEQFEWLTDILDNHDGTEQRIALRPRPRRKFTMALTLLDDADRKALYDKLYKTIGHPGAVRMANRHPG